MLNVDEIQFSNAQSCVRVNGQYTELGVGIGVYQSSVFSPLIFILVSGSTFA